jgi:hypothetical protein
MTSKRKFFALIIAGVIVTLVTVVGARSNLNVASSPRQHLEGTWFFTVTPEGMPPATDLITFTIDGGLVESLEQFSNGLTQEVGRTSGLPLTADETSAPHSNENCSKRSDS